MVSTGSVTNDVAKGLGEVVQTAQVVRPNEPLLDGQADDECCLAVGPGPLRGPNRRDRKPHPGDTGTADVVIPSLPDLVDPDPGDPSASVDAVSHRHVHDLLVEAREPSGLQCRDTIECGTATDLPEGSPAVDPRCVERGA